MLSSSRVLIVGLGLMGGSLAMALRGRCAELLGVEADPLVVSLARELKVVDRIAIEPSALLPQADVVILATPVRTIIQFIRDLPFLHPGSAVVFDLGSTKQQIAEAMAELPRRFDPIGGHPMCGKERSSLAHAEAGLFQGAVFALTPLPRTTKKAKCLVEEIVRVAGSRPLWIDPETHDCWVAATSHLPYLVASALASTVPLEARPLAGPGFRSTTRLASTPLHVMEDILITNQQNVLTSLARLRNRLSEIEDCLTQGDWETLEKLLSEGVEHHDGLTSREGNP